MNIDNLFDLEIDQAAMQDVAEAQLLPEGTYYTVPPLTVKEPTEITQPSGKVRYVVAFNAMVIDDAGHKGFVTFRLSPQMVLKGDGTYDLMSRLTERTFKLYKRDRGEVPEKFGQIVEFLRTTPVKLRIGKMDATDEFDARNVVFNISAAE